MPEPRFPLALTGSPRSAAEPYPTSRLRRSSRSPFSRRCGESLVAALQASPFLQRALSPRLRGCRPSYPDQRPSQCSHVSPTESSALALRDNLHSRARRRARARPDRAPLPPPAIAPINRAQCRVPPATLAVRAPREALCCDTVDVLMPPSPVHSYRYQVERQLRLTRQLAESFSVHSSDHVGAPPTTGRR